MYILQDQCICFQHSTNTTPMCNSLTADCQYVIIVAFTNRMRVREAQIVEKYCGIYITIHWSSFHSMRNAIILNSYHVQCYDI
jgi:hypothetical protein